jgi:hypothetical protein
MPTKRPRNAKVQPPPEADDFKPIKGINTMIENRLHAAGILTYEQLAALSPAEIAKRVGKLTGVNVDRIKEQNWAGQARELAGQRTPSSAGVELENVGFVVDLFLDPRKHVQSIQVLNVTSGVGDTWKGWDETRLLKFFVEQSHLKLPPVEPPVTVSPVEAAPTKSVEVAKEVPSVAKAEAVPAPATVAEPAPPITEATEAAEAAEAVATAAPTAPEAPPDPILRELQMVHSDTLTPTSMLKSGEPFHVLLELNLTEQLKRKTAPLNYTASVYAKRWEDQSRYVLGEAHGEIKTTDEMIDVEGLKKDLQPGVYSLTASLIVMETEKGSRPHPVAHSSLTDRLFHVN